MRYALLLYADPQAAQRTPADEATAELGADAKITEELAVQGVLVGGEALMPAATGTVVRLEDGQRRTEPARTSDLELSGFYIVDGDEQQALDIAARMPVATHGAVEVRPVMDFGGRLPE